MKQPTIKPGEIRITVEDDRNYCSWVGVADAKKVRLKAEGCYHAVKRKQKPE